MKESFIKFFENPTGLLQRTLPESRNSFRDLSKTFWNVHRKKIVAWFFRMILAWILLKISFDIPSKCILVHEFLWKLLKKIPCYFFKNFPKDESWNWPTGFLKSFCRNSFRFILLLWFNGILKKISFWEFLRDSIENSFKDSYISTGLYYFTYFSKYFWRNFLRNTVSWWISPKILLEISHKFY